MCTRVPGDGKGWGAFLSQDKKKCGVEADMFDFCTQNVFLIPCRCSSIWWRLFLEAACIILRGTHRTDVRNSVPQSSAQYDGRACYGANQKFSMFPSTSAASSLFRTSNRIMQFGYILRPRIPRGSTRPSHKIIRGATFSFSTRTSPHWIELSGERDTSLQPASFKNNTANCESVDLISMPRISVAKTEIKTTPELKSTKRGVPFISQHDRKKVPCRHFSHCTSNEQHPSHQTP